MICQMTRRTFLAATGSALAQFSKPVNLVLILTDNHGPWSLGCYGNPDVRTPHIDRLARDGALFTQAFAVNAVCSPTRASLLTGLMPSQHGVHTYLNAGPPQVGAGSYNTIAEFDSLPEILVRAGYKASLSGKWHLGDNLNPQEGCSYWVTKPHGASAGFYDQEVIEGGRIRKEPEYLTDFWTRHGVRFLEQHRANPFFLLLAYNGPYGLGSAMKEPIRNRHAAFYADHDLPSFPRDAPHPWNFHYGSWVNDVTVRRKYAAEVSGIDDGVGQIMEALDRLGVAGDTLVVFVADQGLAGGHSGFWGMGDHTRPLTAFDWGMRIPLIFRHRGRIPPGTQSDLMVDTCDLLPTILQALGMESHIPTRPALPGRSFAPVLQGRPVEWDDTVYFEFENVRAIRTREWKYIERIHEGPNELYHVKTDAGERLNLYGYPDRSLIQADVRGRLRDFFDRYADPKWDLWKGGQSKSELITGKLFGISGRWRP